MKRDMRILFTHYDIGERDGVNAVIFRNVMGLREVRPSWQVQLAGKVSSNIAEFEHSYGRTFSCIDLPLFSPGGFGKTLRECPPGELLEMGEKILEEMKRVFSPFDVIIAENLQVGIHPPLTYAFFRYAQWCRREEPEKRFIFRAHDFYRDRPENFAPLRAWNPAENPALPDWHTVFFPQLPNVFFMAINTYSLKFLYDHGVPEERLLYLPNCIDELIRPAGGEGEGLRRLLAERWDVPPEDRILFSPIRCAPRKNIEESLLLLAVLNRLGRDGGKAPAELRHGMRFRLVLSMHVETGKAASYSRAVEDFVRREGLPAHIGFRGIIDLQRRVDAEGRVAAYSLADAYAASAAVLTTSVLEGFGFVFLEPWLTGRFLVGRDIRDITHDFTTYGGLSFDTLYEKLTVDGVDFPLVGTDPSRVRTSGNLLVKEVFDRKLAVVRRVLHEEGFFLKFVEENRAALVPLVHALRQPASQRDVVERNAERIRAHYTRGIISRRLAEIIERAAGTDTAAR